MKKRNEDLTGRRYGRLTVLKFAGYVRNGKEKLWECRCDCGNVVQYEGVKLRHGRRVSCGCIEREIRNKVSRGEWFGKSTQQRHVRGITEDTIKGQEFPQDSEENEYRYIEPEWLDAVAKGLTAGAVKHPRETWRTIPSKEHAARAIRHLNMYLMGDCSEPHLENASMRVMMAFATAKKEDNYDS